MGLKTELIRLIETMPDEAKKEALKYVKKISSKFTEKTNNEESSLNKFIELTSKNKKYGFKGLNRQELYDE